MATNVGPGSNSPEDLTRTTPRDARQLHNSSREEPNLVADYKLRTPLYSSQHSERYSRQELIREYNRVTASRLIVVIDALFHESVTYVEELLLGCDPTEPLHVLLASPGGDGEVALRLVRSMQARCSELIILVPDTAKSAATVMCLGADRIIMAPSSDLGPIDPQFPVGNSLVGAKQIEAAVRNADARVQEAPDTYPLYSALLSDVNMLMVEQARAAIRRSHGLLDDALACAHPDPGTRNKLTQALRGPLVDEAESHAATIGPSAAIELGLPIEIADTSTYEWQLVWALWTRYFTLGCFPAGRNAIYENDKASQFLNNLD
jgi:hypothetical protein